GQDKGGAGGQGARAQTLGRAAHAARHAREPARRDRARGRASLPDRLPARRVTRASIVTLAVGLVALAVPAMGQPAVEAARSLLVDWHGDPTRIDRARGLLEAEASINPTAETLIEPSAGGVLSADF